MPQRSALVNLFQQVDFHPLSIGLLAQQLKERRPAELGERLEALLEEQPADREDRSLLASLELSIERLPERCRKWLPRLGVFAGGGLEEIVVKVARLEDYPSEWSILRHHLNLSGLMQAEQLREENKIWLRFHPTLAPALWQKLDKEKQDWLAVSHWQAYYQLSEELHEQYNTTPHATRAIAQHELPNLLQAVHATLQVGKKEKGVRFADNINTFLRNFGMQRDYQELAEAAAKAGGTVGSQAWCLSRSNLGEQLMDRGQITAAAKIFQEILSWLREETPSYDRCLTLGWLGRCYAAQGQLAEAEQHYRQELVELVQLEQNEQVVRRQIDVGWTVRRQTGVAWTDLADVLRDQGSYMEAKAASQAGLEIMKELSDNRGVAVLIGQLGTLAYFQGELDGAAEQYREALSLLKSLNEPISEAVIWHRLAMVYQDAKNWEAAEHAYRESARLKENQGVLAGSVGTCSSWDQLAQVCEATGRKAEAEQWYSKALAARRTADDRPGIARTLSNLADLLANNPARLDEGRRLAEEGLVIDLTLDPAAAQIWKTYELLAQITSQQGDNSQAARYRAKSRHAYLAFPSWRKQLHQHGQYEQLIAKVVREASNPALREELKQLEQNMSNPSGSSWTNIITAIRNIIDGERDEAVLYEPLNFMGAAIIRAILEGLEAKGGKGDRNFKFEYYKITNSSFSNFSIIKFIS